MFGFFRKKLKASKEIRVNNMIVQIPLLGDSELLYWQDCTATSLQFDNCRFDFKLLNAIEEELEKRGFKHMVDF